ncbi:MAG: bifunctional diguanylate cyclase/phosphodiesterase [Spirochaetales bacterium]|nr:bifunctional diguanylate cyclase/phosphodiesterase [Spirochaetales bacterium]
MEDLHDELKLLRDENEFLTHAAENIHLLSVVAEHIALRSESEGAFPALMESLAEVKECDYLALLAVEGALRLIEEYPPRDRALGSWRSRSLPTDYREINTREISLISTREGAGFWRDVVRDLWSPAEPERVLVLPFFRQSRPHRVLILTLPADEADDLPGFLSILERIRDIVEARIRMNDMVAEIHTLNDQLRRKLARERAINADLREQFATEVTFDSKTGLLSRYGFFDKFTEIVAAESSRHFAVMKVNINRFATVNHTMGPDAGDVVIRVTAQRIQRVLRYTDLLARVGSDHFLILLVQERDEEQGSREIHIAHRIFDEMDTPFALRGKEVFLSVSIGITYPSPEREMLPEKFADEAHEAMVIAKEKDESKFEIYSGGVAAGSKAEKLLEIDLWKGIKDDAFFMLFQPIVSLETGRIVKLESLVRWNHPTLGQVTPDRFIPIADKTGLIVELGSWILRNVAASLRSLDEQYPQDPEVAISVNVSVKQLIARGFVEHIRELNTTLSHGSWKLGIEITESELIRYFDKTKRVLENISSTGIAISLDDFGTGYSSLGYLPNLKYDTIKIPREFVRTITTERGHRNIVKAIIDLAHTLDKRVIVEGVETREQLALVGSLNADYVQGYFFLKPTTKGEIIDRLRRDAFRFAL